MSDALIHAALRVAVRDAMTSLARSEPVAWPNESFTAPSPPALWLRVSILSGETERGVMTGSRSTGQRRSGRLVLQIFAPRGQGDGAALTLATSLSDELREKRLPLAGGAIDLHTPSVLPLGDDGRGWWQANVSIPYDSLKT